ncbi:MAG: AlpA family phage regulatory protein [Acetobacterales bacterium]
MIVPDLAEELADRALLDKKTVCHLVSLSYPTIWTMMREGKFPRSVRVAQKAMWRRDDVLRWLDELPEVRLKGDPDR